MKRSPILVFILVFCIGNFNLIAQVLYEPVIFPDGLYIKEHKPTVYHEKKAYLLNYFLPQLINTAGQKNLKETISLQYKNYVIAPLKFDDCVYFNDAVQHAIDSSGNFSLFNFDSTSHFPPSLRFYTDGNKNNIDSLFSMNLYTTVGIENYTQPFYFRKYEITNAEYREFVNYVIDSVARRMLAANGFEDEYLWGESSLLKRGYDFPVFDSMKDQTHWPLKMKTKMRWDTSDPDYKGAINDLFLPNKERFYNRREIDTRKLIYEYCYDWDGKPIPYPLIGVEKKNMRKKTDRKIIRQVINVYPDTLCWVQDFAYTAMEKMRDNYFSNPEYANYPVVGITYNQAKAFLHWKTIQEQKKLDAKKIKLNVEYDLPSEIEWEIAATSVMENGKLVSYGKNYPALADHNWLTDLMLDSAAFVNEKVEVLYDSTASEPPDPNAPGTFRSSDFSTEKIYFAYLRFTDTTIQRNGKTLIIHKEYYAWSKPRDNFFDADQKYFNSHYSSDSYIFTAPADLQKVTKFSPDKDAFISSHQLKHSGKLPTKDNSQILTQLDGNGISFMGGNVSEWLNNNFSDWRPAFLTRLKMLHSINMPDAQQEYQWENYFFTFNSEHGKLVRGSNWFDERNSKILGKNPVGTNAKTFVDPNADHCTLGFRYVIHVTKK